MYEFDRGLALVHMSDAAQLYRLGDASPACGSRSTDPLRAPRDGAHRGARHRLDGSGYLRQRLDARPRQFLPLHRAHQVDDVLHPADPRGGRGHQHGGDAGDDREGEADRHRDPAHHRRGARATCCAYSWCRARSSAWSARWPARCSAGCSRSMSQRDRARDRKLLGMQFLDASVYYMSDLPSEVQLGDVLQVSLVALAAVRRWRLSTRPGARRARCRPRP